MMKNFTTYSLFTLFLFACLLSCQEDGLVPTTPIEEEPAPEYDPTPYELDWGYFPDPKLPEDNPLTAAGVALGRLLFYEKKLSADATQSCADCHQQATGFSDERQFSIGVAGLPGKRQAMPLVNMAWHRNGFFWDARAATLREQALFPIQDPLEMNESLDQVIAKLKADKKYRDQFVRAFGEDTISPERIGRALEQFELTLVSTNSKYDRWLMGEVELTESEERGRVLFFTEYDPTGLVGGAECLHCHSGFNFTNDLYMNNGLDAAANQLDEGLMASTGKAEDRAKFKTQTLRNIALTAPYMHDGRFATLEAAIEHYNTGTVDSPTIDPRMQSNLQPGGLGLSAQDITDLVAFLHTLTDEAFLSNPAFSAPE